MEGAPEPGTSAWVVWASRILWTVALPPNTCLIPWISQDAEILGSREDEENLETLLKLAEAFFPLISLVGKKIMALTDGSIELALLFCAGFSCKRLSEWLASHYSVESTPFGAKLGAGLLLVSCTEGHVDYAKWALSKFPVSRELVTGEYSEIFAKSFRKGRLEACKFLVEQFGFTAEHACMDDCDDVLRSLENGHVDAFKWLVTSWGLTRDKPEINKHLGTLVKAALKTANPEFVEWFFSQFKVRQSDISPCIEGVIHALLQAGSCKMAKWLTANYDCSWEPKDHSMVYAETGQVDFVEWLCDTYPRSRRSLLSTACRQGHFDSVKLICEKTDLDSPSVCNSFLGSLEGFLEIAQYLERKYGPFDPVRSELQYTLQTICSRADIDSLKWVTAKYPPLAMDPSDILHTIACSSQKNPLPFLQWLFEEGKLEPISSLHAARNKAFRMFCVQGNVAVLKWLLEKAYITASDLQLSVGRDFDGAEERQGTPLEIYSHFGNIGAVKWLSVHYSEIAQQQAVACIRRACRSAHTSVVKFLLEKYSPSVAELCSDSPCIMNISEDPFLLQLLRRLTGTHIHE